MMLSHSIEHGVLVITLHTDPGIGQRAELSQEITDLVHAYSPLPVVIVLDMPGVGGATVSAVLRAQRMCHHLGVLMSVSTHSAATRRILEANCDTGGTRLVVHARTDVAITAAFTAAA
ncbi:hypothetical protein [Streptomyces avermitilis]|uniref:hypothetical protein n=1 Tax=Streptomyces avermitilis TaxID=33903 RepID=UPI003F52A594